MASAASSSLKSALTNATTVAREAAKKQQYLDSQFQIVQGPQRKATFQELFLQLGKIYAVSQDVDGGKIASQTLKMVQLIVRSQETPETHAKCAAIATVVSKAFDLLKAVAPKDRPAFLQRALTALLVGKEMLILVHRMLGAQHRVEIADQERTRFFTWMALRPENFLQSEFNISPLLRNALTSSLSALAAFLIGFDMSGKRKMSVVVSGKSLLDPVQSSPAVLEKWKAYLSSSDSHLRVVAQAFLSWYEMAEAIAECKKRGEDVGQLNQGGKKVHPFIKEPILQQCVPEIPEMWETTTKWFLQARKENPNDQTVDPAFIKQQQTYWSRFVELADSRHFVYDFLYQMLVQLKQEAPQKAKFMTQHFSYDFSSPLHFSKTLLKPAKFARLSVEKSIPVISSAPASVSAAVTPDVKVPPKTREISPKKPSKKKGDFFDHLDKTPSADQLNVKTKEPVPASAASPQTASAASAAPLNSLASLLKEGNAFMAQRLVDERIELWLTDPETALKHPNYQHLSEAGKKAVTWRHALPRVIRLLLGTQYSMKGTWQGTNTSYSLFAEIEDEMTGKKERSVLQYCEYYQDGDPVLYHQFAGLTSNDEQVDLVIGGKVFDVLDFPDLKFSQKMAVSGKSMKPIIATVKGDEISVDPLTSFVTVRDSVHKKKYTIIPLGE